MTNSEINSPAAKSARRAETLLESPSFSANPWQMSFGERAAIEGVLAQLRPRLALEIGTAEGGSLGRIAAYSERVISFDLVEPDAVVQALENVELRTGDSHALLALELERLAAAGEQVDFVMVDGDHSADGARQDVEDLLASDALKNAVILAHDSLNQEVRSGLEAVAYGDFEKVALVDLDFVGGYVPAEPPMLGECWGGLALIVVDESARFGPAHEGRRPNMAPLSDLIWPSAEGQRGDATATPSDAIAPAGDAPSQDEASYYRRMAEEMRSSLSWRLTAPLRAARARLRQR